MLRIILSILICLIVIPGNNYKMADDKIKNFLKIISQIESSGGKNYNHPLIKKGPHTGHRAIGKYGLMPNTVSEIINRIRMSGASTPELQNLSKLDPHVLKTTLETNPEIENKLAEALAQRVLEKQQDEEKAAYSWFQGHNLSPERIEEEPYKEHDYVKKYNMYKNMLSEE